ncbi:MAG: hypothetical protein GEU74_01525 [Nitriliruptorales bacterium]|nr:hypothetical protein [Nitriliruptorales bacterium]
MTNLIVLGSGRAVPVENSAVAGYAGARVFRSPDGTWLLPAFRNRAVEMRHPLPPEEDEDAFARLILDWVEAVRRHDWTALRGQTLDNDADWVDLRTAMVRVGWAPAAAQAAWERCRRRPYDRALPTAAGWAAAGWVVPAAQEEVEPVFAQPVLETRGLLRWAYITRWSEPPVAPDTALPPSVDPAEPVWADVLSRLRQDHYSGESLDEAQELAVGVLAAVGLAPRDELEAEDEPLPDRHVAPALTHEAEVVRSAGWFLLRAEADTWLACGYGECQHHWAVEAEEDAYEMDEVLELAGYGVTNPVDAAYTRRRLLTVAFGDVNDVPLAGMGDVADFVAFYTEWVAHGRPEDDFEAAAAELRGDDPA